VPRTTPILLVILLCTIPGVSQVPTQQLHGLNFSPYLTGQDPNLGAQVSAAQIASRMQFIAPYTKWVRTYGSTSGLENTPAIARQFGLKIAAGAWLGRDSAKNSIEINNLISAANSGLIDIAIVGNEVLLTNDLSVAQLISYMNQVRQAIPSAIPVTTSEPYSTLLGHPDVMAASDVIFANFYPFWEGVSVANAMCVLQQQYQQIASVAGGKQVIISETGWPTDGNAVGAAIPSALNAGRFFMQVVTWATANNIPFFYFESFDETWKATYEGPQGAHWGIWDSIGNLKPEMAPVFSGQTETVACDGTIDGAGTPAISFAYVPPYGSYNALQGRVVHVKPSGFRVAVYIKVAGGWWTKPTFAQPTTPIQSDGTWVAAIVTGGADQLATGIAAFLIPSEYNPPLLSGAGTLPDSLVTNAVAYVQVQRSQNSISGTVTDTGNRPLPGVTIAGGALGVTVTAPDGRYSFFDLPPSGTATLTPEYPNFVFTPPSAAVTISSGNQAVSFTGQSTVDLTITLSLAPPSASIGASFTATFVAANAGVANASSALVVASLPAGLSITQASTTRGTCSISGRQLTCDLGPLAPTVFGTITMLATSNAAGSFTISATVSGLEPDSNSTNNSASGILTVSPPSPPVAAGFYLVTPCRVADTRSEQGKSGAFGPPYLSAYSRREFPITSSNCGVPSVASAFSLNVTVLPGGHLDFLSTWPAGEPYPGVSTLNSPAGTALANAAIVPAGTNGAINVVAGYRTELIIDVNGYFAPPTSQELVFYPITPCRAVDTRPEQGKTGAFGPPALAAYSRRDFPIRSSPCAVPSTAQAYALNVTVLPPGPLSFLSMWPAGQPYPGVSTLNSPDGSFVANAAIVPAGINGSVTVVAGNPTELLIDITGYFAPPAAGGLHFYALRPCRVMDTRAEQGRTGAFGPPRFEAYAQRSVPIPASACGVPAGAQAYSLNFTAVPSGPLDFLSAWPAGQPYPGVSTLNSPAGRIIANAAIVPAGTNGAITLVVGRPADVIIDINGYFAP
jgi:exo-beta-1,3-glucanase (GH17 family)